MSSEAAVAPPTGGYGDDASSAPTSVNGGSDVNGYVHLCVPLQGEEIGAVDASYFDSVVYCALPYIAA